jgi:serine-type D-Ala-D-Ala endopeptidase (penicillin-binding protein 7)
MYRIIFTLLLSALLFPKWAAASPPITATSWLVADDTGHTLQNKNSQELRSIASISKLMTVMVVLDAGQDLDEFIKPYTRRELIQLALVKSDNNAASLLCKHYPGGMHSCIQAMNTKARYNDMSNTKFIEPTGLSVFNVSTAEELVKLVLLAKDYPEIISASNMSQVKIKIKKQWLVFNNTNPIIGKRHEFIVSKTGYIRASGGCIVMMLDTDVGRRIVVVLGSRNTRTRIPEAEFIAAKN